MASQHTLQPRTANIKKSYKNTCGSPAPRTSLLQLEEHSTTGMIKSTKGKKAPKPNNTDTLVYTITGDRLPVRTVSIIIFPSIYLTSHDLVVQ